MAQIKWLERYGATDKSIRRFLRFCPPVPIKVSRVINRKKTHISLGVYAVVDGKRVGTSVPCPPNLTKKQIKETLHYGEQSLRREIAKYLASKERATPIELIGDLAAQRLAQRDK